MSMKAPKKQSWLIGPNLYWNIVVKRIETLHISLAYSYIEQKYLTPDITAFRSAVNLQSTLANPWTFVEVMVEKAHANSPRYFCSIRPPVLPTCWPPVYSLETTLPVEAWALMIPVAFRAAAQLCPEESKCMIHLPTLSELWSFLILFFWFYCQFAIMLCPPTH